MTSATSPALSRSEKRLSGIWLPHGRRHPDAERVVGHGLRPQDDARDEAEVTALERPDLAHAVAAVPVAGPLA
jgi:hypothetical protein